jgi:methionine aminopeptidase
MYLVGDVPLKARRLVDVTYECLMIGIEQARPGARLGDIGAAIQAHAERQRYGVVRDFCGHGWAACSTTRRKWSMSAAPAPAPNCAPACSSRSSR